MNTQQRLKQIKGLVQQAQAMHKPVFIGADELQIFIESLDAAERERDEYAEGERLTAVKNVELQDEIYGLKAELARRDAAAAVAYADPLAFNNFAAGTASKEWMWAKQDEGLVPVYLTAPPAVLPPVANEREAFNTWNNDDNLPIAGVPAKNAAWLAWQARAALCAQPAASVLPELNSQLIDILGRPNFTCSYAANILRKSGMEIKRKSENEQATVIYFLLNHYFKHGDKWFEAADKELAEMAAAPAPGGDDASAPTTTNV